MAEQEKSTQVHTGYNHRSSTFRVAEAYKMIRTNLMFALANTDNRVVVFSSAEPGAGKSTLCANLAISMAQAGKKVILLDADMRKPVQHRNFRVSKTLGLSKILGGLNDVNECIYKQLIPNLDLIPSGSIPPNPSELLGSARMAALTEELRKRYDFVFVDTPPLGIVTDALALAPQAAGVVLVARHKQTMYDELSTAIENIKQINASLLGVVLTDTQAEKGGYAGYTRKKYYQAYNYEYFANYKE